MTDKTMTLEQVRDRLRDESALIEKDSLKYAECAYHVPAYVLDDLADAIEAAIAARKVPDVAIYEELGRAIAKFPTWPTDPLHALAVLGEEFGELTKAALQLTYEPGKSSREEVNAEAIQTAAMAIRFVRSLDVYCYARSGLHPSTRRAEGDAMKRYDRRDDFGSVALICLLSAICWLAVYGAIELIRAVLP
jgi:hypothetical protein